MGLAPIGGLLHDFVPHLIAQVVLSVKRPPTSQAAKRLQADALAYNARQRLKAEQDSAEKPRRGQCPRCDSVATPEALEVTGSSTRWVTCPGCGHDWPQHSSR
jgi:hypothetical protein